MKNHIYIRPLRMFDEGDRAAFIAAASRTERPDPASLYALPSTQVMVAERREDHGIEVVMYQPFYHSLVLGSIIRLGSDLEIASAMHQMTAAAYTKATTEGYADVVMFSDTEATQAFASRHGYEKLHSAYKLAVR